MGLQHVVVSLPVRAASSDLTTTVLSPARASLVCEEVLGQGPACPTCPVRTSPDFDDVTSGLGTPLLHAGIRKETSPLRKRRRRGCTMASVQEQEIRRMLKLARCQHNHFAGVQSDMPTLTMDKEHFNRTRDLGLAMLVMVSDAFDTSTRTLVLAVSIFDRFLDLTIKVPTGTVEVPLATQHDPDTPEQAAKTPLACFVMACKFCETDAPCLADVIAAIGNRCTVQELREAENSILACLHWDIDSLTGETLKLSPPCSAVQVVLLASPVAPSAALHMPIGCC